MPHSRRYYSNPVMGFLAGSVVNQLIAANFIVFTLEFVIAKTWFVNTLGLTPNLVVSKGYVWQVLTYMFLHGGFWHLFLNMFIIWMFGRPLEGMWGRNRFLVYYLLCGLGGAAFSFIFSYRITVIGASGAGYGILLAYAMLLPETEVYVWGLFPVRTRTLVIFMTVIEFAYGISGSDGRAHFAHLGGMAAGFVYLRSRYRGRGFRRRNQSWKRRGDGDENDRWTGSGGMYS